MCVCVFVCVYIYKVQVAAGIAADFRLQEWHAVRACVCVYIYM